jgi:uncharacterized protein
MFYLLLIIILFSIIYIKYTDIDPENFKNYSLINDMGISIDKPLYNKYTIGTGEYDTPYHIFGKAISNLNVTNIGVTLTSGSIINIEKVNSGEFDYAICQEDILYDKVLQLNKHKTKMDNVRFVTGLYDELYFLMVHKNASISAFTSIGNGFTNIGRNYIIGTGDKDSGSLENLQLLCKIFNINLIRFIINGSNTENANGNLYYIDEPINYNFNLFLKEQIDGVFYISGPKIAYMYNISKMTQVKFIPLGGGSFKILKQLMSNKNSERDIKIAENISGTQNTGNVQTQGVRAILICNKKMDNSHVYDLLKSIYSNVEYIKQFMANQNEKSEFINNQGNSYYDEFKPLEMFYINKNIIIHPGAHNFYNEYGYINREGNKECNYNFDDSTCNLVPSLDKKDVYWKYKNILASEIMGNQT